MTYKHTCKGCVFARDNWVRACDLDMLEKFLARGEVISKEGDSYAIHERVCPAYRTQQWLDNTRTPLATIQEELRSRFEVVIYAANDEHWSTEDFVKTVQSLNSHSFQPARLSVINNRAGLEAATLVNILSMYSTLTWNVENVHAKDIKRDEILPLVLKRFDSTFFLRVEPGEVLPAGIFADIDALIQNCHKFTVLYHKLIHHPFIHTLTYLTLTHPAELLVRAVKDGSFTNEEAHKFADMEPLGRIWYLAEKQGRQKKLIVNYEDLCYNRNL